MWAITNLNSSTAVDIDSATTTSPSLSVTNSADGFAIPAGSGLGWYNYDPSTHSITPIPGRVLLIRTADGRFAKMSMVNYYKGLPEVPSFDSESRFITFDFVFQPDGSRSFN